MSLVFDTTTDSLSRTANNPAVTSFTMMGWFYFTSFASYNICLTLGANASGQYYQMESNFTGGNSFALYNSAGPSNGNVLSLSTWYHLAMTVAGTGAGQFLGYQGGVLEVTHAGSATPTNAKMWVGNNPDSDGCPGMRAAAVKVYGAVLTAAEILQEMRQIAPVRTANLNNFLPMVDSTLANNYKDYSGNAFDLTAGGTLVTADGPPVPWRQSRRRSRTVAGIGSGAPPDSGSSTGVGMQRPVAQGWT
jgi:hypothetical protein